MPISPIAWPSLTASSSRVTPPWSGIAAYGSATGAAAIKAEPQYWKVPWAEDHRDFQECPNPEACVGVSDVCAEGYTGNLCTNCIADWGRSGSVGCKPCWSSKDAIYVVLVLGALVVVAVFIFLVRSAIKSKGEPKKLNVAIAKIALNHFQLAAMVQAFPLDGDTMPIFDENF